MAQYKLVCERCEALTNDLDKRGDKLLCSRCRDDIENDTEIEKQAAPKINWGSPKSIASYTVFYFIPSRLLKNGFHWFEEAGLS